MSPVEVNLCVAWPLGSAVPAFAVTAQPIRFHWPRVAPHLIAAVEFVTILSGHGSLPVAKRAWDPAQRLPALARRRSQVAVLFPSTTAIRVVVSHFRFIGVPVLSFITDRAAKLPPRAGRRRGMSESGNLSAAPNNPSGPGGGGGKP